MTPTWPLANIFFSSAEDFFKLEKEDMIFNGKIMDTLEHHSEFHTKTHLFQV